MTCHFFIICPEFVTENLFGVLIKRGKCFPQAAVKPRCLRLMALFIFSSMYL